MCVFVCVRACVYVCVSQTCVCVCVCPRARGGGLLGCASVQEAHARLRVRRYASLYFVTCIDKDDNELITLETIHHYVEVLDQYFGNVCELDIIFNFHKARGARAERARRRGAGGA